LLCAPIAFDDHELITAGIWLELSRVYEDCKDKNMYVYAVNQTLDAYNYAYTQTRLTDSQSRQVCFLLGELNFKLGDYEQARQLFYKVKTDALASPALTRAAEDRFDDIREIRNENAD